MADEEAVAEGVAASGTEEGDETDVAVGLEDLAVGGGELDGGVADLGGEAEGENHDVVGEEVVGVAETVEGKPYLKDMGVPRKRASSTTRSEASAGVEARGLVEVRLCWRAGSTSI
ncbi:MAG: hypothetical protein R3B70_09520 [Polyangiaceae bacterium]